MAQRRMLSKKIIDTDEFLNMPVSARELYFQLLLRADDEGFVGNTKTIMRMVGATNDDIKILVARRFIIPFESGIIVVRHWFIHNYIQKDRFQETQYIDEKKTLTLSDTNTYELVSKVDTECIQNGDKMDTQDRLGKKSIDESNNICPSPPTKYPIENKNNSAYRQFEEKMVKAWNEMAASMENISQVKQITADRRKKLQLRFKEKVLPENMDLILKNIKRSLFLNGKNQQGWVISFDWLIKNANNCVKVLEGHYKNKY